MAVRNEYPFRMLLAELAKKNTEKNP